ncbi:hypothetical protein C6P40_003662, partial [Pichia californica]
MSTKNKLNTNVDELPSNNFQFREEDDFNIDGIEEGNPEIDYYPGMSNRHSFLGEPEDIQTKINRFFKKIRLSLGQKNIQKLIIGLGSFIMVVVFFSIMFFAGEGSDSLVPGGAQHRNGGNPVWSKPNNDDNDSNSDSNNNNNSDDDNDQESGDNEGLFKMSLDDMRTGEFWVFDYPLNFIEYEAPTEVTDPNASTKM